MRVAPERSERLVRYTSIHYIVVINYSYYVFAIVGDMARNWPYFGCYAPDKSVIDSNGRAFDAKLVDVSNNVTLTSYHKTKILFPVNFFAPGAHCLIWMPTDRATCLHTFLPLKLRPAYAA